MQSENSRLKIHTGVRPAVQTEEAGAYQAEEEQKAEEVRSERRRRANDRTKRAKAVRKGREALTVTERLLRNSAVSCALLLTVLALRNINQPWSEQASEGIRQAMTMQFDWDDTLGKLSFVRALVPDTALVFLNMGEPADLCAPVSGVVTHEYSEQQPWLEYRCPAGQIVCAAIEGRIAAAGQGAGGEWTILIEREDGAEAVYGYLKDVYVLPGQQVRAGDQIGVTADQADGRMYFEYREEGEATDPSARMK